MYGSAFSKSRGTEHWVGEGGRLVRFITGQAGREAAGICFGRGLGGTGVLFGAYRLWFQVGERDTADRSSWSACTVVCVLHYI